MYNFRAVLRALGLLQGACFAVAEAPAADFHINPKATYLRVNNDPSAAAATPIPLVTLPFDLNAGDFVRITRLGDFNNGRAAEGSFTHQVGVFSATNTLLGGANPVRVPGALEAGLDVETLITWRGMFPTDIPEDFEISGDAASGKSFVDIRVPEHSAYLFVAAHDNLYGDNSDSNSDFLVRITPIPGDFNRDGGVDGGDLLVWQRSLGMQGRLTADSNLDGVIDVNDLNAWKVSFGYRSGLALHASNSVATQAAPYGAGFVPEPSDMVLAAFFPAALGCAARRRKVAE